MGVAKTNPRCVADRHAPGHKSFLRGCRCPATVRAEDAWREANPDHSVPTDPACTAHWHGASDNAWRRGCRCPQAIKAHDAKLDAARKERAQARQRIADAAPRGCPARVHNTRHAYLKHGCTCPEALRVYRASNIKQRGPADPRLKWRGPKTRVGRNSLWRVVHGIPDSPTDGEQLAAMIILEQRPTRAGMRTPSEIAVRMGVTDRAVYRMRQRRERLREQRAERRAADAAWKAARAAEAAGRKEREAQAHEQAHTRKTLAIWSSLDTRQRVLWIEAGWLRLLCP